MSFKIILIPVFLSFIFLIFVVACQDNIQVVERNTTDIQVERAYVLPSAREKGLAAPEIDFLSDEKINEISKTLVNIPGTTQEELNDALTLLYRMKKSDYEKTWLLYLEHQLENVKTWSNESRKVEVHSAKNRIEYWKSIFEKCQNFEKSYVRLPQSQRKAIKDESEKEMRGMVGVRRSIGVFFDEFFK